MSPSTYGHSVGISCLFTERETEGPGDAMKKKCSKHYSWSCKLFLNSRGISPVSLHWLVYARHGREPFGSELKAELLMG